MLSIPSKLYLNLPSDDIIRPTVIVRSYLSILLMRVKIILFLVCSLSFPPFFPFFFLVSLPLFAFYFILYLYIIPLLISPPSFFSLLSFSLTTFVLSPPSFLFFVYTSCPCLGTEINFMSNHLYAVDPVEGGT